MSTTPLTTVEDPKIEMLSQLSALATNRIVDKSKGIK